MPSIFDIENAQNDAVKNAKRVVEISGLNLLPFDDVVGVETNATTETYTFSKDAVTTNIVVAEFSTAEKTFITHLYKTL